MITLSIHVTPPQPANQGEPRDDPHPGSLTQAPAAGRNLEGIFSGWCISYCRSFNVGTTGAKVFSGPASEEFGHSVQQFTSDQGKWLLVGSPWSGSPGSRKGDVHMCELTGQGSSCEQLNLHNAATIPGVESINANMSLGLMLTRHTDKAFMACGPLWARKCGNHFFYPGLCVEVSPRLSSLRPFSPVRLNCGPVDVVVVLDGSDSIYPWPPVIAFLKKLLENLDIGPDKTQVSVLQYSVGSSFEFRFNSYRDKESTLAAVSHMEQKRGDETNTFSAIQFVSEYAFHPQNGGRPGATKVMVVVSDGESNDKAKRNHVIEACELQGITRFSIAVLGYYSRNNIDPGTLIEEMESIASSPTQRHYFHVAQEEALLEMAGTLGDRIFNIEGAGKGEDFQMEFAQVGFSAHKSSKEDLMLLGAVGAYGWSGTVVHQMGQSAHILPEEAFHRILGNKNHSAYLGYAVTSVRQDSTEYFVAGAPRANHSGLVVVYSMDSSMHASILDTQRGTQIGSYFGSVLCPVDVNRDGVTDVLLVGAPMFMSAEKKETGRVHLFSITHGLLHEQGHLVGPSGVENARFGVAISAVPDLNLDGFSDVVVGAPLEDSGRGAVYVFSGDDTTVRLRHSQRILGSEVDPGLQYFGRSLDGSGDLNRDSIPDVSVGAYGKVVQLWSRGVCVVAAEVSCVPERISILNRTCPLRGRLASCFSARVCFTAQFRPRALAGPAAVTYTIVLDADLQSPRASSRGLFYNGERTLQKNISVRTEPACEEHTVYMQNSSDWATMFALRVDIALQETDSRAVLDVFASTAWDFFIPFSKDCGLDGICVSDLQLRVRRSGKQQRSSPMLVSHEYRRLSFTVSVSNKGQNAYGARVLVTYSKNLFYASLSQPNRTSEVECTLSGESKTLLCQVGFPALRTDQTVTFKLVFDFNTDQPEKEVLVIFEVQSESAEENPMDNKATQRIPVLYDTGIILTSEADMSFYMVENEYTTKSKIKTYEDIGKEFNFTYKVSTGSFPVGRVHLTISLPVRTFSGNPLLHMTGVTTQPPGDVSCEENVVMRKLNVGKNLQSPTFIKESFKDIPTLDCNTSECQSLTCVLRNVSTKSHYSVNVTTRIWNSTFALASFKAVSVSVSAHIESDKPDLLLITDPRHEVTVTVFKSGRKAGVPFFVIVGSVLGGLLLLAIVTSTMWTLGFFKRKQPKTTVGTRGERENETN
ncbi:integrin alpha-2-like [Engraulis encrasicolus]|uniref:integrin alpha-2-like n=1 Tax=Engraulis encrasicolus TaxID=184585 RepID=UPI002FD6EA0A